MSTAQINVLISIVLAASAIYIFWKKGGNQASAEILAMYKARDEIQDKDRKEMKDQIKQLTSEVGRLSGIIEEKDRRIQILESVDIKRNPEMVKFMTYITAVSERSEIFMKQNENHWKEANKRDQAVLGILAEIKNFMGSINQHMIVHHPNQKDI